MEHYVQEFNSRSVHCRLFSGEAADASCDQLVNVFIPFMHSFIVFLTIKTDAVLSSVS